MRWFDGFVIMTIVLAIAGSVLFVTGVGALVYVATRNVEHAHDCVCVEEPAQ